jgi:putative heme transporter
MTGQKHPLSFKFAVYLANTLMVLALMYLASDLLIPLFFGILFSLLLLPLCKLLERTKMPRALAVLFTLIIVFMTLALVGMLLANQFINFADKAPIFITRINEIFREIQHFFKYNLGISVLAKYKNAQTGIAEMLGSPGGFITNTIFVTTGFFVNVGMVIVYSFFFLLYRKSFNQFVFFMFPRDDKSGLTKLLTKIKKLIQSYMLGILSVITIVGILNSVGLMLLGIENAIFLGAVAALFAIIPYIGVFIGAVFPFVVALITKDSAWYPVGVAGLAIVVHLLEGNFITPYFVGRRVSINPLSAIVGIIAGHMIWGISGMILSLPIIAVFKSIFDSVEHLKPYGYMLGLEISDDKPDMDSIFNKKL